MKKNLGLFDPSALMSLVDTNKQQHVAQQLRIATTIFDVAAEAIVVTDKTNTICAVNPAFSRITGYSKAEVLGKNPQFLSSGRHDVNFYRNMWQILNQAGQWQGEIWNRRKSGEIYPEWLTITKIEDETGDIFAFIAIFTDISKIKQDEEQLWRQTNYDFLTGLPNNTLLNDRLSNALITAMREEHLVALLFIDLDHFKVINNTLGHAAGDLLLQKVAQRLLGCVTEMDTVARFSGDKFTIVLNSVEKEDEIAVIAENIIEQLTAPFELNGHSVFVGTSIGVTVYPTDANDADILLRNADIAMYRAKSLGPNVYQFFTSTMNEQIHTRMSLEHDLRHAIEREELELYYQPIVDLETGFVAKAEALLRWEHPSRGKVPPYEFIPLAEETGLITKLGEWVLYTAARQMSQWQTQVSMPISISINVSTHQLKRGLSIATIADVLSYSQLASQLLTLEITESLLMEDTVANIQWFHKIKELGVKISIDDFGTGYSSLSYLKRFPLDFLKIDRSFIRDAINKQEDASLVKAIIAMAQGLKLKVIAEGVETQEQLSFLHQLHCEYVQGFYFFKPLSVTDFEKHVLEKHNVPLLKKRQSKS
ncbi:PAS domain S-box/diguanylate cyclase (GGDEF) domain-containing protein [Beggiatoa alba B18LD]|uniref:cyclic-guanylate-specific phosphodiesterase n=1 Tax=Beggiatoa alba B18LD TaxID=395493 RepID=I3CBQ3_9GAMM|nr:EAL domain-containing protein [Beggiatoa alba]EIJ41046.1 PAS domain S-box/diguanylate cyclase (GGDEF) domain-containing protein [Beggiatoa alba B18LD]